MDNKALATEILKNIGGKENVSSVVHCATRLRFRLKDEGKADTEAVKKIKGVLSVVNAGGQYQVVIGPDVPQVYQEVVAVGGFDARKPVEDDGPADKNKSKLSSVLEAIASMFQPIIPAITGAGLLKAIMALLVAIGVLDTTTQTYTILNAFADAAFYFLPILLAASAAKRFKCNQFVAMALGGILVYPQFISLISAAQEAGTGVSFLGLPVTLASYSSSVIPIILGVWFMSVVEHFVSKISPKAIKFFSVPLASIFVGGTVTIIVLGPIGTWVGDGIALFFEWLNSTAGWAVPTLVGIFNPLLVMTGTHYGLIPIGVNNLATTGFDTVVGPGMLTSNVAQGAAGLAVAVRSKNRATKELASSSGLTGLLGITEPVLYGINLRFIYPLIGAMIGGGVGGLFLGITGVGRYASGSPGLLVLPAYIGGDSMNNLIFACIGTVIAIVVSFIATFILFGIYAAKGKLDPEETGIAATQPKSEDAVFEIEDATDVSVADDAIVAVANGELIPASRIKDEAFAAQAMGQTVAVEPTDGVIVSPANGEIELVFDTGHAFAVRMKDGTGLLVHIGIDTVSLEGKGFHVLKKQGDTVRAGEPVVRVDLDVVEKAGLSMQTMIIVTEPASDTPVAFINFGKVQRGQVINK